MTIIQTLIKAHYVATDAQVEHLARDVAQGQQADGTYLRVLVVACQADLGKSRRKMAAEAQEAVIDKIHTRFYIHVQKGVGNGDLTTQERNRRSTFARTAASALRSFVGRGGDIRELVSGSVTKSGLLRFGATVPTGTRAERSLQRSTDAMVRAAQRVAKADPDAARERIEAAIDALQAALEEIDAPPQPQHDETHTGTRSRSTPDRGHARSRVEPMMHRSA